MVDMTHIFDITTKYNMAHYVLNSMTMSEV